jgi:streptogramin lyase
MDRALVIRTTYGYVIDPVKLGSLVHDFPGAIWLIGNEPDSIWQDNIPPEEYARIYHDFYRFIKARDATSRIAAGGIVQPTPLRLEYLDRVLAAYWTEYRQFMPVDVWHIHNAVLNEVSCDYDPFNCWGAQVPPGIDAPYGEIRGIDDNDNMPMFKAQIRAFRQWLADRGYRGYPLIVTEYGVLMPAIYGYDAARVNRFMSASFDFLGTETDPDLGNPCDSYHLVQSWAWFSLDVPPYDPITGEGFNGNLFEASSRTITAAGQNFADRTRSLPPVAYVDLAIPRMRVSPPSSVVNPPQMAAHSVEIDVANIGTTASSETQVKLTLNGPISNEQQQHLTQLQHGGAKTITFSLTGLPPGGYTLTAAVDPAGQVAEPQESNNKATRAFVVYAGPPHSAYLPMATIHHYGAGDRHRSAAEETSQAPAVGAEASPTEVVPGLQEFEVPTPASFPAQLALDTAGRVWITERDANKIACLEPDSVEWTEYPIPTASSQPWDLALDSSGFLWFTETAGNRIGKLDPNSGAISETPIPTTNSQPWDLTVGVDGTVWFTERAGNKLGKLTPATGIVAEYALPEPSAEPVGIGVNGSRIWYTEMARNRLALFNADNGQFAFLDRPPGSSPQEVAMTSVGNIWWAEPGGNRIVQFAAATTGSMLPVEAPSANSEPFGIALQGNQAVWFTERAGNRLARTTAFCRRFDPANPYKCISFAVLEISLPTPSRTPTGLAIDSAGCAWYTAPAVNRIGRQCLHHAYLPMALRGFTNAR